MDRRTFLTSLTAAPLATIPRAAEPIYTIPHKGKLIPVSPDHYARHMARLHRLTSPEGKAYLRAADNWIDRPSWMR